MKPYYSLNDYFKETFGEKIYKLALDGGMTCPNRDGLLSTSGCIFCSHGGSGDFAQPLQKDINAQIEAAKESVKNKMQPDGKYFAYFQSYTNTYGSYEHLNHLFTTAIHHPDIVGLSIATRPDCLPEKTLNLLEHLNQIKPVWIELGLQTIHEDTAHLINRAYPLSTFLTAYEQLRQRQLTTIVHVILGLPGETRQMMLDTVSYLGNLRIDGIKLQLLHVLKNTALETLYENEPFPLFTLDEYADLIADCICLLPKKTVIHRISGDGPKDLLIAPLWSGDKRRVLNTIHKRLKERNIIQGSCLLP